MCPKQGNACDEDVIFSVHLFHTCKLHVDTLYPREQETRTLKHYFHTSYRDY